MILTGKVRSIRRDLSNCHFIQHISHIGWPFELYILQKIRHVSLYWVKGIHSTFSHNVQPEAEHFWYICLLRLLASVTGSS